MAKLEQRVGERARGRTVLLRDCGQVGRAQVAVGFFRYQLADGSIRSMPAVVLITSWRLSDDWQTPGLRGQPLATPTGLVFGAAV